MAWSDAAREAAAARAKGMHASGQASSVWNSPFGRAMQTASEAALAKQAADRAAKGPATGPVDMLGAEDRMAAATLAAGNPKAGVAPVHSGAMGRSEYASQPRSSWSDAERRDVNAGRRQARADNKAAIGRTFDQYAKDTARNHAPGKTLDLRTGIGRRAKTPL